MKRRSHEWREVQPRGSLTWPRPASGTKFTPCRAKHNAPADGVLPMAEAPTEPGYYIVKYPTARSPFVQYFGSAEEMEGLHRDNLAFYRKVERPANKKARSVAAD